jgi:6-phosphogluconolactonase
MVNEHFFHDKASWLDAAINYCAECLANAGENKSTVYLSGGSTPVPLYKALSRLDIPFDEFDWGLVDERWVESSHPRSNYQAINQVFAEAEGFSLLPMKNQAQTPQQGLPKAEEAYQGLSNEVRLTILGMGDDGHTASFFPNAEGLAGALDLNVVNKVAAINAIPSAVTGSEIERVTLTLQHILSSEHILLLISGESKKTRYSEALAAGDFFSLPVAALLQQNQKDIDVFWCP